MIENIEHLKTLMEVATESIVGRQVKIYLRSPIKKGFIGEAYIDTDGTPAMGIKPDIELKVFYFAWLEEISHIWLGHLDNMEPRITLPPELQKKYEANIPLLEANKADEQKAYDEDPREQEAQSLAYSLDDLARRRAYNLFFTDAIETRIRVLANIILQKEPYYE